MNTPIGFFDSGVGGTSIWKEVITLLPNENTIYLADSKNAPYGQKSKDEIIHFSIKNTELLLNLNAKLIVVACNTATTNAIDILREKYKVPFIGIEPAIKPAELVTQTKKIGILATKGTLNSAFFESSSEKINSDITMIEQIGEGLVNLIEEGKIDSEEMKTLLQQHLTPMLQQGIDALVLGCTHYPYLIPKIKRIVGNKIKIIDSGLAVAKQTKNILKRSNLLNKGSHPIPSYIFYSNKNISTLKALLNRGNINVLEKDF